MIKHIGIFSLTAVGLAGCMVGPNYQAPTMPAPPKFATTQQATTQPVPAADLTRWWESFNDPALNRLIARGVDMNLDIWLAQSRVREARAALGQDISGLFPKIDATSAYTRGRTSQNILGGLAGGGSGTGTSVTPGGTSSLPVTGTSQTSNLYQAGFDMNWELDVFGGTRRAIEASSANLQAQIEARRNTTITLLAEVARNYLIVRGAQHERAAVLGNIAAQKDTMELLESKFRAGIATDLDVARQEAQVASTESQLPGLETEIQQAIHRLGVLLDCEPAALEADLSPAAPLPVGPPTIPAGLPSELLRRRPDVREAERRLAAASANIGVAVAELFPKFSMTGSFGIESSALKTLTRGSSEFWSMGPAMTWRIFDGNQIWSNIWVEKTRYEQAYIQYRQTVLQAMQEVEDALVAYNQEQIRRDALQRSVDANVRSVALAKHLNQAGVLDFLNVLTAQQTLFVAQDGLALSDQTVSTDLVALYKSLGGGWDVTDQPSTGATTKPTAR